MIGETLQMEISLRFKLDCLVWHSLHGHLQKFTTSPTASKKDTRKVIVKKNKNCNISFKNKLKNKKMAQYMDPPKQIKKYLEMRECNLGKNQKQKKNQFRNKA